MSTAVRALIKAIMRLAMEMGKYYPKIVFNQFYSLMLMAPYVIQLKAPLRTIADNTFIFIVNAHNNEISLRVLISINDQGFPFFLIT